MRNVLVLLILSWMGGAMSSSRAVHAAQPDGPKYGYVRIGPFVEEGFVWMSAPEYAADGVNPAIGERTASGLNFELVGTSDDVWRPAMRTYFTRERLDFRDYEQPDEVFKSKGFGVNTVLQFRLGQGGNVRILLGAVWEVAFAEGSVRMAYPDRDEELLLHAKGLFSGGGSSGLSWSLSGTDLSIEVGGSVAFRMWDAEIEGDRSGGQATTLAITAGAASITWAPIEKKRSRIAP